MFPALPCLVPSFTRLSKTEPERHRPIKTFKGPLAAPQKCALFQGEIGQGAFQELDQVAAVQQFTKYAGKAKSAAEIPAVIKAAVQAAVSGRPGPSYVDIPSDVLMASSSGVSCLR